MFHEHDSPKLFYSTASQIDLDYLRALLSSASLFCGGVVTRIPHYAAPATWRAILRGEQPELEADLQAAIGRADATQRRIALEPDALAACDGATAAAIGPADATGLDEADAADMEKPVDGSQSLADDEDLPENLALALHAAQDGDVANNLEECHQGDEDVSLAELLLRGTRSGQAPPLPLPPPDAELLRLSGGGRVGPFRLTTKKGDGGQNYGGIEAGCPFHKKNLTSGCKNFFRYTDASEHAKCVAVAAALWWSSQALHVEWQWLHLSLPQPQHHEVPPVAVITAHRVFQMGAPQDVVPDLTATEGRRQPWLDASSGSAAEAPAVREEAARAADAQARAKAKAKARVRAEPKASSAAQRLRIKASHKGAVKAKGKLATTAPKSKSAEKSESEAEVSSSSDSSARSSDEESSSISGTAASSSSSSDSDSD